jgi:hypothetical protein
MGEWYAVETVDHNRAVEPNTVSTVIDVCPVVRLWRGDDGAINLRWKEKAIDVVHKFRLPNSKEPGFWDSAGRENGET